MTAKKDRSDSQGQLKKIGESMHDQFPNSTARLEQLDAHLATVAMVIDHIYDEADKEQP